MRRLLPLLALLGTPVVAADAPVARDPLAAARAELARATAEEQRLTAAAAQAKGEAQRLAGEQRSAAAAIAAAEARIDVAQGELSLARAAVVTRRQRLAERQAPAAGLVAGLVSMGRRPPLLALANGSVEEFVRVRALLDATMPVIRARSATLAADLAAARQAEQAAAAANSRLLAERTALDQRRVRFAGLERKALAREAQLSGAALGAGDITLAEGETVAVLGDEAARRRAGLAAARELAGLDPLPARPSAAEGQFTRPPFAYALPADAPLIAGLGSVNGNGIRSRGLTLATARGAEVRVPADGTIAFAGPYRRTDGIVVIDHGGGWLSLLLNVSTTAQRGAKVRAGEPLGRALGPLGVELSRSGTYLSPAFIAASSVMLSKGSKGS